jgi:hypothetical protein
MSSRFRLEDWFSSPYICRRVRVRGEREEDRDLVKARGVYRISNTTVQGQTISSRSRKGDIARSVGGPLESFDELTHQRSIAGKAGVRRGRGIR